MQDKLLQKKNIIITGVVVVVLIAISYYFYRSATMESANVAPAVDPSLFGPVVKNYFDVKGNINLNDSFMKGKNEEFFTGLKNYSQEIRLKDPEGTRKGRLNPFVPYVAP